VVGEVVSGRLYRVVIPAEVFDGCRAFPADIRIVDKTRATWPFFLWSPPERASVRPVFATLGRRTGGTGGQPVAQELVIRLNERGEAPRHNQVSILTAGHNFIRRVEVLGSADGQNWRELGSGHLVDQMRESHVSNRMICYEDSAAPRLMLRIRPSGGGPAQAIEVLDAQVAYREPAENSLQEIRLEPMELPLVERRKNVVMAAYDTGAHNRPLERLTIRISASGDFALPVKVFGRNESDSSWRWIADGGVYNIDGDGNNDIDLNAAAYRQIKVEIYHQNAKPPVINHAVAWWQPQYIVFESMGGEDPVLHYGGDRMPLPRYDLQRRTSESDITDAPLLALGKPKANPLKVASGLSAYLRALGWAAAVLAASAFFFIVLRSVRARL